MNSTRASTLYRTLVLSFALLVATGYVYYWSQLQLFPPLKHLTSYRHGGFTTSAAHRGQSAQEWPHIIWQTSKTPESELSEDERRVYESWRSKNKGYRQEVMTDQRMEQYVRDRFRGTDVEKVYFEAQDYIMLSDLIRYLILLKDGGVYSDLDVGCERAISRWLPSKLGEKAGVVLGVEVDNKFGPDGRTFEGGEDLFELVNWTMMTKPGQPFMKFLVKRVVNNVRKAAKQQGSSVKNTKFSIEQVLRTTGPAALTAAFFDYATNLTGSDVTYKNFTKMTDPKLVGEVLILPIYAFGAGHQIRWGGFKPAPHKVLVHHYFNGGWKEDHASVPPSKRELSTNG